MMTPQQQDRVLDLLESHDNKDEQILQLARMNAGAIEGQENAIKGQENAIKGQTNLLQSLSESNKNRQEIVRHMLTPQKLAYSDGYGGGKMPALSMPASAQREALVADSVALSTHVPSPTAELQTHTARALFSSSEASTMPPLLSTLYYDSPGY